MARFDLEFAPSVKKDLKRINRSDVHRILEAIDQLQYDQNPQGSKKLVNEALFRIRVGVYRIVYEIHERKLVVLIVKVGHRKSVYK
ncbi:MAG: Plasmid stabilization system protein [Verrucomicrobia bacterium ADurb.Bin474]|nr:MAG: Plasmid stabilization system protein [Verrucomicrobia bacterium ADurb.Bin474]